MTGPLSIVAAGAVGACVGSYATTAAIRAARSESSVLGRSHCDGCGITLGLARTVPVLSYVGARGQCAACGSRIDPLHPVGEIAGAAIAALAVATSTPTRAALIAGLGLCLLASSVIDLKTRRLPDGLTLAVAGFCAALAFEAGALVVGAVAAIAAFVVLEAVRRGFALARHRPGLGFGDVKLIAALSIWLGPASPWAVVLASVIGLAAFAVSKPADGRLAFGPPIALAAFLVGLCTEAGLWPFPS